MLNPHKFSVVVGALAMMLTGYLHGADLPTANAGTHSMLPKRVYTTQRVLGSPPKIDGHLDDACWAQGEWAGNYIQREPREGAAPTEPTELKILYDDHYLYVAIRALDTDMIHQPRLMGRRDEFTGDMVGVTFDSFFNHRTAFEFDVTSGGSKLDLILRNDATIDLSWNAVWDVKVSSDERGWYAEFRIPLNQLRYSRNPQQVWGLHSWRWIRRNQEESDWHLIPMDHQGFVYSMGELHGIENLPVSRHIELLPYVVGKYSTREKEIGNPYRQHGDTKLEGGLDAKVGVTSDFTLDLTINPDFGQVEADPSEVNLTSFETFFPERRPFFLEGKSIFDFALDDDQSFYSRRIGHAPSLTPIGAGFVNTPESARILGAAKLTGRTPSGFSLGILDSVTERMEARVLGSDGVERRSLVEPQTQYFVVRGQNDFDRGNTLVGGIVSLTTRQGSDGELRTLPQTAFVGGVDVFHQWSQRSYYIDAKGLFTQVKGSPEAIMALMTNPVHNYERPDADHLELDPDARTISGNAGRVRIGKGNNGVWRYYTGATWRSPGVEFNDLGYLKSADWFEQSSQIQYYNTTAGRVLRRRDIKLRETTGYDYSGTTLYRTLRLESEFGGVTGWYVWSRLQTDTARLDTRVLRGGPALRLPASLLASVYAETDGGRPTQLKLDMYCSTTPADGSYSFNVSPGVVRRVGDRFRVEAKIGYEQTEQDSQYVGQSMPAGTTRYVMGRMDQKTLSSELRLQVNFSPTVSLTYFGGPFASVGKFERFKWVENPRAGRASDRFGLLASSYVNGQYVAPLGGESITFSNPDFTWRELKSNLVFRWEFRAGSTLYAVWSQNRGDARDLGAFSAGQEYARLFQRHPDNTFLIKMSYWFSL